jgi:hypothetical protein
MLMVQVFSHVRLRTDRVSGCQGSGLGQAGYNKPEASTAPGKEIITSFRDLPSFSFEAVILSLLLLVRTRIAHAILVET